eukprot:scaffold845_cov364-Prasinococcus_capsulatus_cf.AAC.22
MGSIAGVLERGELAPNARRHARGRVVHVSCMRDTRYPIPPLMPPRSPLGGGGAAGMEASRRRFWIAHVSISRRPHTTCGSPRLIANTAPASARLRCRGAARGGRRSSCRDCCCL